MTRVRLGLKSVRGIKLPNIQWSIHFLASVYPSIYASLVSRTEKETKRRRDGIRILVSTPKYVSCVYLNTTVANAANLQSELWSEYFLIVAEATKDGH